MNGKTPVVPPPPPEVDSPTSLAEVAIRTMASDIDSISRSGGGSPRPIIEAVAVAPTSAAAVRGRRSTIFLWALVAVVGAGALFFAGYYLIPFFVEGPQPTAPSGAPSAGGLPGASSPTAPLFVGHKSFFRTPPDEVVTMKLGGVSDAQNLQSYAQRLIALLQDARADSVFVELAFEKADGQALSFQEFLFVVDADVFDRAFLSDRFEGDFTAFVHRNERGIFWPGYILKSKGSPAAVRPDVSAVERASSVANLFLTSPGNASGTFGDVQVAGQPFRAVSFKSGGAKLIYGWVFGNYLVLSTSEDGLKAAIAHL